MIFKNEYRSYSNWARQEVIKYVKENPDKTAIESVEKFIRMMDCYSCKNPKTSIVFSIAHDVALDILDHLLTN